MRVLGMGLREMAERLAGLSSDDLATLRAAADVLDDLPELTTLHVEALDELQAIRALLARQTDAQEALLATVTQLLAASMDIAPELLRAAAEKKEVPE